jgi:F-type H+-transporting ATPase subunit epsilon
MSSESQQSAMSGGEKSLSYRVSTPEGTVEAGTCQFIVVPTTGGEMGVMAEHAALVACVAAGTVRVTVGGDVRLLGVGSGLVDVRDNEVRILVSHAQRPSA